MRASIPQRRWGSSSLQSLRLLGNWSALSFRNGCAPGWNAPGRKGSALAGRGGSYTKSTSAGCTPSIVLCVSCRSSAAWHGGRWLRSSRMRKRWPLHEEAETSLLAPRIQHFGFARHYVRQARTCREETVMAFFDFFKRVPALLAKVIGLFTSANQDRLNFLAGLIGKAFGPDN